MAKSLIGKGLKQFNKIPVPMNDSWNTRGGYFGYRTEDKFTMLQTMGQSGTLFAIVQLLSSGTARHDWRMYRLDKDGRVRYTMSDKGSDQRVEVLRHQALNLWRKPNAFMTGMEFREMGWQFQELVGEQYIVLDRGPSGTGVPIEMWPVRPDRMEPVPHKEKFLAGWVYTSPQGEPVPLLPDEVIQMKYPDPQDFFRGMSPVQSLLYDIDNIKYTAEWSRNFFLNSATPGGIVTFDRRLNDEEFQEFVDRWREQHQGVSRGHRVGVLEQGAIWTPNTYTLKDMEFNLLRQGSREIVREAYRIHAAMLGLSTDVNRANAQTAAEIHVAWHEIPRLVRTRDMLNHKYLPMFAATAKDVEFDFVDPTPATPEDANLELRYKSWATSLLVQAGYDPADVLEAVGLPPMEYINILPEKAPRPSVPSGPLQQEDINDPERGPGSMPTEEGDTDQQVMAMARMIRDAFDRRASNGHQKELV